VQPRLDRGALQALACARRQPAAASLELGLEWLQTVDDVRTGARLELELGRREGDVHGTEDERRSGGPRRASRVARRWRVAPWRVRVRQPVRCRGSSVVPRTPRSRSRRGRIAAGGARARCPRSAGSDGSGPRRSGGSARGCPGRSAPAGRPRTRNDDDDEDRSEPDVRQARPTIDHELPSPRGPVSWARPAP
jgi:hypothetical protein